MIPATSAPQGLSFIGSDLNGSVVCCRIEPSVSPTRSDTLTTVLGNVSCGSSFVVRGHRSVDPSDSDPTRCASVPCAHVAAGRRATPACPDLAGSGICLNRSERPLISPTPATRKWTFRSFAAIGPALIASLLPVRAVTDERLLGGNTRHFSVTQAPRQSAVV